MQRGGVRLRSRFAVCVAVLLFSVQVFLPLSPVFADETTLEKLAIDDVEIEVTEPIVVDSDTGASDDGVQIAEEEQTEQLVVETAPLDVADNPLTLDEESIPVSQNSTSTSDDVISDDETVILSDDVDIDSVVAHEDVVGTTTPDLVIVEDNLPTEVGTDTDTPSDDAIQSQDGVDFTPDLDEQNVNEEVMEEMVEEHASTTETTVIAQEIHTVLGDSYAFSKEQCVRVEDGSYYCRSEDADLAQQGTDRIYAAPDIEGDMELYIDHAGETTQLTFNTYDDGAPFYDPVSNTIVFHRLIEGRYQIVVLDLADNTEKQLTFDRYNNMEPSRAGDSIVWQGWVGNDWEIFLEHDERVQMITDNTVQDIGPVINGEYVIWQTAEQSVPMVKMYNIRSGAVESIPGTDGVAVMNPRMVLVYDTEDEHGDTFTLGYDLKKKHVEPLSASPRSLPDSLPDPDQGNEERALITQVTQLKTKTEEDHEGDDMLPDFNSATSSDPESDDVPDIVVPPFQISSEATSTETNALRETPAPSSIPDLVIGSAPIETVLSVESIQHIEDLIVPPLADESTTSDPQM